MNEIIQKISSYNLFNYLLPGVVFSVFIEKITPYKIIQNDLLVNVFLIYFAGLVVSRIGSLIVEPIFKRFVDFASYADFVEKSKQDPKLEILSEANNTYRTFIALFIVLFLVKLYSHFFNINNGIYILMGTLFILFVFSYVKQIKYIIKRINSESKDFIKK